MKKLLFTLIASCALLLPGCIHVPGVSSGEETVRYDNAERYAVGEAVLEETVKNIDIDWLAGSVTLKSSSDHTVVLTESADHTLPDELAMRWWLDGDTLRIRFCQTGRHQLSGLKKDLTLSLPNDVPLDNVMINTVSADVDIEELTASAAQLSSTSGDFFAQLFDTARIRVSTVSGTADLTSYADAEEVSASSVSGDLFLNLGNVKLLSCDTVSGRVQTDALQITQARADTTSGNVAVEAKDGLGACEIGTVSGKVTLYLPESAAFSLEYHTNSGALYSDFALRAEGKAQVSGSGEAPYQISTTSGNLDLRTAG